MALAITVVIWPSVAACSAPGCTPSVDDRPDTPAQGGAPLDLIASPDPVPNPSGTAETLDRVRDTATSQACSVTRHGTGSNLCRSLPDATCLVVGGCRGRPSDPVSSADAAATEEAAAPTRSTPDLGLPLDLAVTITAGAALAAVPLIRLYRRLDREELLDNPLRDRIYETIREEPGATAADVADTVDTSYHGARYHLDLLAEFEMVTKHRIEGSIRYALAEEGDPESVRRAAVVSEPRRASIVRALIDDDGLSTSEIARRADIAPATASHHLDRLQETGLVTKERDGVAVRHYIDEAAVADMPRAVRSRSLQ